MTVPMERRVFVRSPGGSTTGTTVNPAAFSLRVTCVR